MNTTPGQRMVVPIIRDRLRLAGNTTNKLKAEPVDEHMNELSEVWYYKSWQRDCTKMISLL